jgi:hypothetical protein
MKFFTAAIAIACTINLPASCFAKDVAPVGDRATGDMIQEEVQLVVINSSGVSNELHRVRQQFSSIYSI